MVTKTLLALPASLRSLLVPGLSGFSAVRSSSAQNSRGLQDGGATRAYCSNSITTSSPLRRRAINQHLPKNLAAGYLRHGIAPKLRTAAKWPQTKRTIWSASVVGREPGLASSESQDGQNAPKDESLIRIVDFAANRTENREVKGSNLEAFLQDSPKPDWAATRWIYVNGLNGGVVRSLGKAKGLHHLALEDVLEKGTPVKADWYDNHCFMVLALQKLERIGGAANVGDGKGEADVQPAKTFEETARQNRMTGRANAKIYHFQNQPFAMDVEQAFMFLTTDNTVITIFERSGEDVFTPIMRRLESSQTVMRSSNDPSMLVQGIIDTVVDLSIPIGKAVGGAFSELEEAVLTQPAISQSKQLYVLRSGLTILMDNISANGTVVRELISHRASSASTSPTPNDAPDSPGAVPAKRSAGVVISPLAQVYLQDVQDHIRTLAQSTHMSIRSAENLTTLIFNTIAATQNESVRQLTLISCFFLPLTFLTGYFGMNFDPMPVVNEHSDAFFWYIAGPMIAGMSMLMLGRGMWVRMRGLKQRGGRR